MVILLRILFPAFLLNTAPKYSSHIGPLRVGLDLDKRVGPRAKLGPRRDPMPDPMPGLGFGAPSWANVGRPGNVDTIIFLIFLKKRDMVKVEKIWENC